MTIALRHAVPASALASSLDPVEILGVPVTTRSLTEVAETVVAWAGAPRSAGPTRYVCATSAHGLVVGADDPTFRRILADAAIVTPDGMPLVWCGRLAGRAAMERVYGPTLTLEVCRRSARHGLRHFFYGGAAGVADELARVLADSFPGLIVAGTYCPPFRELSEVEHDEIADRINAAAPDIIWVGLSTPKQERWIAAMRSRVVAGVMLSVGAAFDFHTGRVPQAPSFLQRAGLEWLFRLVQEPRRLWRRYAYIVPKFIWLAFLQTALRRFERGADRG
ncbi:MAG TPA: WecB/TagA/CpsF family glycosyltransferase [Gemmatimonadaceae bacterium]|nr:WecB/TagA/CpsF family glycosyltransferase [Gemmatimonadaceae bacterium]